MKNVVISILTKITFLIFLLLCFEWLAAPPGCSRCICQRPSTWTSPGPWWAGAWAAACSSAGTSASEDDYPSYRINPGTSVQIKSKLVFHRPRDGFKKNRWTYEWNFFLDLDFSPLRDVLPDGSVGVVRLLEAGDVIVLVHLAVVVLVVLLNLHAEN